MEERRRFDFLDLAKCVPSREIVVNYYRELRRVQSVFFEELREPDWRE